MAQRRQADAGLNGGRRVVLTRLLPITGAVGWLAATGGCTGLAAPVVPARSVDGGPFRLPLAAPAPALGERWRYRETNNYDGAVTGELERVVTALSPLTVVQRRLAATASATKVQVPREPVTLIFADPWSAIIDADFDTVSEFSPPVPLLPPRLEPGSSTLTQHEFVVPGNSGRYSWQQEVTALAARVIDTPAGRFDALEIRRRIWFVSPDPFRFDRVREDRCWYAPAVNGFVRRTWTGSYIDEGSLDSLERRREDWITAELIAHDPGDRAASPRGASGADDRPARAVDPAPARR